MSLTQALIRRAGVFVGPSLAPELTHVPNKHCAIAARDQGFSAATSVLQLSANRAVQYAPTYGCFL
jgi:hypothetical protein